jgi:hypothetical protein
VSLPGITGMHGLVGAVAANPAGAFTPAALFSGGVKGGYWDPSDINTLWKDTAATIPVTASGDGVARIDDKSGNGNHLVYGGDGSQPYYTEAGTLRYLRLDDSNTLHQMLCKEFVSGQFGTNWSRVSGLATLTDGESGHYYSDFGTGAVDVSLRANNPPETIYMHNATSGGPEVAHSHTIGATVITELWKSPAPSSLEVDNGGAVTSPSIVGVGPHGILIGWGVGFVGHETMHWYGAMMIDRNLSSTEIAQLKTFYGTKVGKSL